MCLDWMGLQMEEGFLHHIDEAAHIDALHDCISRPHIQGTRAAIYLLTNHFVYGNI
jgi:hypothetical protein